MKTIARLILASLAASVALSACTKEIVAEKDDSSLQVESIRSISLSFGISTKTAITGFQPEFVQSDSILISNGVATDTCEVNIVEGAATINTYLHGVLKAVYPFNAALLQDNKIIDVIVPPVQSGKFSEANICMARMSKRDEDHLTFINKTAVLKFYVDTCIGVQSILIESDDAEISSGENPKKITVSAPENGTLYGVSGGPDKRICYATVKPGVKAKSLQFTSVTTSQEGQKVVRQSPSDSTLEMGKMYNAFIPYYIDLGDAGKWGYCNVGAFLPEEPGDYFAWGEVKGHSPSGGVFSFPENKPDDARYTSTWNGSKGFANCNTPYYDGGNYSSSKYSDSGLETLEAGDDAALSNWGSGWRMPTRSNMEALAAYEGSSWDNAKKGYCFGAEPNMVFLPVTGYGSGAAIKEGSEVYGVYWSSSLDAGDLFSDTGKAFILYFQNPNANSVPDIFEILSASTGSGIKSERVGRQNGCTIRPYFGGTSDAK